MPTTNPTTKHTIDTITTNDCPISHNFFALGKNSTSFPLMNDFMLSP